MNDKKNVLLLRDVGFRVGENTILQHVGFSLSPGEFKLITGPSGCGKSTLLKIVASLLSPTEGAILFEGEDIASLSPESYRQQVSYCVQTPVLFGDTVYDNLIFRGKSAIKRRSRKSLSTIWPALGWRRRR